MKSPIKKPDGAKRLPVAPPVYRPQPVPKVLQRKIATAPPSNASVLPQRKPPVAPPVYRPQAPPKVLQAKSNLPQRKQPVAPPVYRPPQRPKVLQPKSGGPPARATAQPKATPAPLKPPRRIAAPVFSRSIQRAIDYDTEYMGKSAKNADELIEQLVDAFGEANRETITAEVTRIDSEKPVWSMKKVWVGFGKYGLPVHEQVAFASSSGAPSPRPLEDFSLPRVTRLIGRVGDRQFASVRNCTKDKEHAEEIFIRDVETAYKEGHINLRANPEIAITINNSPCAGKCAEVLANWAKRRELTRITIHFGVPYGSEEEFREAIETLQGARIKVHGLDFSKERSREKLSKRARASLVTMGNKLRSARAHGWYESDVDEEPGGEEEVGRGRRRSRSVTASSSRDRSRSRSARQAAEAPEPARAPARPRRRLRSRSASPQPLRPPAPEPPHPPAAPRTRAAAAAAAALLDDGSD